MAHRQPPGVFLFTFDLIEPDGPDLRREPWTARREAPAALLHRLVLARKPPEA
jgi:ATP-dependent DNA ligase